jgi:TupA-like ATPgrasp
VRDAVHRVSERRAFRSRNDPESVWRCCERWPRTLLNKWNGREFAARHGCPVPAVYWRGSDHASAPLEAQLDRFVIRPVFGTNRYGAAVVVDGEERLWGGSASPHELRDRLPRSRLGRPIPILIEEFATPHDSRYRLPFECKLHVFGPHVAAVRMIERRAALEAKGRWYTPDWEPIPDRLTTYLPVDDEARERPESLARMLDVASAIGAHLGTYMRIDFFLTDDGFRFNELSSLPLPAGHNTPFCDAWFGELWSEHCPDAT